MIFYTTEEKKLIEDLIRHSKNKSSAFLINSLQNIVSNLQEFTNNNDEKNIKNMDESFEHLSLRQNLLNSFIFQVLFEFLNMSQPSRLKDPFSFNFTNAKNTIKEIIKNIFECKYSTYDTFYMNSDHIMRGNLKAELQSSKTKIFIENQFHKRIFDQFFLNVLMDYFEIAFQKKENLPELEKIKKSVRVILELIDQSYLSYTPYEMISFLYYFKLKYEYKLKDENKSLESIHPLIFQKINVEIKNLSKQENIVYFEKEDLTNCVNGNMLQFRSPANTYADYQRSREVHFNFSNFGKKFSPDIQKRQEFIEMLLDRSGISNKDARQKIIEELNQGTVASSTTVMKLLMEFNAQISNDQSSKKGTNYFVRRLDNETYSISAATYFNTFHDFSEENNSNKNVDPEICFYMWFLIKFGKDKKIKLVYPINQFQNMNCIFEKIFKKNMPTQSEISSFCKMYYEKQKENQKYFIEKSEREMKKAKTEEEKKSLEPKTSFKQTKFK